MEVSLNSGDMLQSDPVKSLAAAFDAERFGWDRIMMSLGSNFIQMTSFLKHFTGDGNNIEQPASLDYKAGVRCWLKIWTLHLLSNRNSRVFERTVLTFWEMINLWVFRGWICMPRIFKEEEEAEPPYCYQSVYADSCDLIRSTWRDAGCFQGGDRGRRDVLQWTIE